MKIKFRNYLIDTEKEPVAIIFNDKQEKINFTEMILQSVVEREKSEQIEKNNFLVYSKEIENSEEFINNINDLKDPDERLMRSVADFENYKKRLQKEVNNSKEESRVSILTSILDLDNELDIAFSQIKSEEDRNGLKLMMNKVSSFLRNNNIETIQTINYDPDLHHVISVIENGNAGKIISVISKGYKMGDKIIRHPQVIIGK